MTLSQEKQEGGLPMPLLLHGNRNSNKNKWQGQPKSFILSSDTLFQRLRRQKLELDFYLFLE